MQCVAGRHVRPFSAIARAQSQAVGRTVCTPVHAQQQQQRQPVTSAAAPEASRRQLLGSAALLGAATITTASLSAAQPAQAAATCELTASPSGLQFCDTQEGTGPEPVKGSLIRCHYTGRLASNGRVFDSSYERGRPLTFKIGVGEVIRGWDMGILGTEGVPAMKEGGKRLLVIPAELGYGQRGAGGVIPPGATLEFEVELLGKRK